MISHFTATMLVRDRKEKRKGLWVGHQRRQFVHIIVVKHCSICLSLTHYCPHLATHMLLSFSYKCCLQNAVRFFLQSFISTFSARLVQAWSACIFPIELQFILTHISPKTTWKWRDQQKETWFVVLNKIENKVMK